MTRLSPELAALLFGLSPRTLHKWAREGRIVRHKDGFEIDDLLVAEASRDASALFSRAGIKMADRPA